MRARNLVIAAIPLAVSNADGQLTQKWWEASVGASIATRERQSGSFETPGPSYGPQLEIRLVDGRWHAAAMAGVHSGNYSGNGSCGGPFATTCGWSGRYRTIIGAVAAGPVLRITDRRTIDVEAQLNVIQGRYGPNGSGNFLPTSFAPGIAVGFRGRSSRGLVAAARLAARWQDVWDESRFYVRGSGPATVLEARVMLGWWKGRGGQPQKW